MRKIFFVIILFLSALNLHAQLFVDIINLKFSRFPKTVLKTDHQFPSSTNQITGELFVPLPLKSKDVVLLGVYYDRLAFDIFKEGVHVNADSGRLHQLSLLAKIAIF